MATPTTLQELNTIVDANIPDNNVGDITEPKMRYILKEIIKRLFQIRELQLGLSPGGLSIINNQLNYVLAPVVLTRQSGGILLFPFIHDAMAVAMAGDSIEVNAHIELNGGSIELKSNVNIDFKHHNISTADMLPIFSVVGDDIVCGVYNIGKISHNWGGDYTVYTSTEENCVLKVVGNNCRINLTGNDCYSSRAGVVFCYGNSSMVSVVFQRIVIGSYGVNEQASFYATSENAMPIGESVHTKTKITIESELLDCSSECCLMADVDAIVVLNVRFVKLNGETLLAIQKAGILVLNDCDVTSESTCMILDTMVSNSNVSIIQFYGKNVLRALGIVDTRAGFAVIAVKAKETRIENYDSLRIAQTLPFAGRGAIGINPTVGSPSVFAQNSYIFNMGNIGTVFPIDSAILRKGFFGNTYILQNNSFGEY
ncbi:MAG: hypothetical protein MUF12_00510 [Sediminibacterium sp.]|jgi:hypothetical protein|nr:hypothetical protein [Sediminibacterium sp.]